MPQTKACWNGEVLWDWNPEDLWKDMANQLVLTIKSAPPWVQDRMRYVYVAPDLYVAIYHLLAGHRRFIGTGLGDGRLSLLGIPLEVRSDLDSLHPWEFHMGPRV